MTIRGDVADVVKAQSVIRWKISEFLAVSQLRDRLEWKYNQSLGELGGGWAGGRGAGDCGKTTCSLFRCPSVYNVSEQFSPKIFCISANVFFLYYSKMKVRSLSIEICDSFCHYCYLLSM